MASPGSGARCASFASRLAAGERLVGTFVKTPSPLVLEVLGLTALDLCCLDTEHAPFGRLETDQCLSQLRAADMPSLVRVADDSATELRCALDAGATGVLVPHVTSATQAEQIVARCRFGEGGRGYAGSTRAAGFTKKPMGEHLATSAQEVTVVLQIEDLAALDQLDDIAAVDGVHALFVGRVDLAVAMGADVDDSRVLAAVERVCQTGRDAERAVGMFVPKLDELAHWHQAGASLFLLSSDQSFLLQGAAQLVARVEEALGQP